MSYKEKSEPWKQNANSMLVLYSILAAICGVIIVIVIQDQNSPLTCNWGIPISLIGFSFLLFIFSAEAISEALDKNDVKKYLSTHFLYNIGVVCLLAGLVLVIYFHYLVFFHHLITCHGLRITVLIVIFIIISFHWWYDLGWLLFEKESDYQKYIEELRGKKRPTIYRKCGWNNFLSWSSIFLRVRRFLHKERPKAKHSHLSNKK